MDPTIFKETDIVVIGSGLAGLRSAISAIESGHHPRVLVVSNREGPSGSSFRNSNDALGMVVCQNDAEKAFYTDRAMEIAPPGTIDRNLVEVMAEESEVCFNDLGETGVKFSRAPEGGVNRYPCCFLPEMKLARMFHGLESVFGVMKNRFDASGGKIISGQTLVALVTDCAGRVTGALFTNSQQSIHLAIKAKAVIVASGGSTTLFERRVSGVGNSGLSPGLMSQSGASFVNMNFFQFLWYDTGSMTHWNPWNITKPGTEIILPGGKLIAIPDHVLSHASERNTHAPIAYQREDSLVDEFLLNHLDSDGTIHISVAGKTRQTIAPHAHACNGGVVIDQKGFTGISGLYACGECTGGMHGANRVGGAMVLSTQVFGKRAGREASRCVRGELFEDDKRFKRQVDAITEEINHDADEYRSGVSLLRNEFQKTMLPFRSQDTTSINKILQKKLNVTPDRRLQLLMETVRLITKKTS